MVGVNINSSMTSRDSLISLLYKALNEFKPTSINGEKIPQFFYTNPIYGHYNISTGSLDLFVRSVPFLDEEQKKNFYEIVSGLYKNIGGFNSNGEWKEDVLLRDDEEENYRNKKIDILCSTGYGEGLYAVCKLDGKIKGVDHTLLLLNLNKNKPILYCVSKIQTDNQQNGSNNSNVSLLIGSLKEIIDKNKNIINQPT